MSQIEYKEEITYTINKDGTINVTHTVTVINNSTNSYIPYYKKQLIPITMQFTTKENIEQIKQSIKVLSPKFAQPSILEEDGYISVYIPYQQDLMPSSSTTFTISYQNPSLSTKIGNLQTIIIPGFSEEVTHNVEIIIKLQNPQAKISIPTDNTTTENEYTVYKYNSNELVHKSIFIENGNIQYYNFHIQQQVPKSYNKKYIEIAKNRIDIVIPGNYPEYNQAVYITSMNQKPYQITKDKDNNLIATYYLPATQDNNIDIEGYIVITRPTTQIKDIKYPYTYSNMSEYMQPASYWESDSSKIKALAQQLALQQNTILDIIQSDYNYVIDNIEYSKEKAQSSNERQGALATIQGGKAVCMEYSDLFIALLRAQEIPSRAAYGIGFNILDNQDDSTTHQWAQVYLPDTGWINVDPTWGETGRSYIGYFLDHALWYVASKDPNTPPPIAYTTADNNLELPDIDITIDPVETLPTNLEQIQPYDTHATVEEKLYEISTTQLSRVIDQYFPIITIAIVLIILLIFNFIIHAIKALYKHIKL